VFRPKTVRSAVRDHRTPVIQGLRWKRRPTPLAPRVRRREACGVRQRTRCRFSPSGYQPICHFRMIDYSALRRANRLRAWCTYPPESGGDGRAHSKRWRDFSSPSRTTSPSPWSAAADSQQCPQIGCLTNPSKEAERSVLRPETARSAIQDRRLPATQRPLWKWKSAHYPTSWRFEFAGCSCLWAMLSRRARCAPRNQLSSRYTKATT
jgi:hypothetical protein